MDSLSEEIRIRMPQGKMKVKSKGGAAVAKKGKPGPVKHSGGGVQKNAKLRKGKFNLAPKKKVNIKSAVLGILI